MQAEAFGHLSCLYLLRAILASHNLTPQTDTPPIKSYIDNLGLIQRLQFGPEYSIRHTQQASSDLIREIHSVAKSLPYEFERHHVRSHQYDDAHDLNDIPFPSRLNKTCDVAADQAYTCSSCPPETAPPPFPSTKAYIVWDNKILSTNIINQLRHAYMDTHLRKYIMQKANWTDFEFNYVAWDFVHRAMYNASSAERKAYTKLQHRLWATNEVLWKRTQRKHDHRCQRCRSFHEDFEHVYRCTSDDAKTARDSALLTLRTFLNNRKLSAPFIHCFCTGITQWLTLSSPEFPLDANQYNDDIFHQLRIAYATQTDIGWDQLLQGRISKEWFTAHDTYSKQRHLSAPYLSDALGPSLIRAIWQFGLTLWHSRNHYIHGQTTQDTMDLQLRRLDYKLSQAYQRQEDISDPADQRILFSLSLDERLTQSHTAKLNWYLLYESCLHAPTAELHPDAPPTVNPQLHEFFQAYPSYHPTTTDNPRTSLNPTDT